MRKSRDLHCMSVNKPKEWDGGVGVFLQFDLEGEAGDPGHLEVGQGRHRPPDDLLEADLPVQTPSQVLLGGGVQEVVQVDGFGSLEDTVVFRELHPSQGEWESVGHEVPVHVVAVSVQVWSLTRFYSVDFSKSWIGVKKCVFNKRTIKVCVSCC